MKFYSSVDNSEYMRNGDFLPTRLQAQQDAVGLIAQSKLRSNPESNVGLMTLSGLEGRYSSKILIICFHDFFFFNFSIGNIDHRFRQSIGQITRSSAKRRPSTFIWHQNRTSCFETSFRKESQDQDCRFYWITYRF